MSTVGIPSEETDALAKIAGKIMCEGYTYQHAFQISDQQVQALYAWGYELQKQKQFAKAERIFQYLCHLNHYDPRYWIALGFCRERRKLYEAALQAYIMAGTLDPQNPSPPLRATECLFLMGRLALAVKSAERVLDLTREETQFPQARDRAEKLLQTIRKRRAGSRKK